MISTVLGGLALPVGLILGFVIPAAMIGRDDELDKVEGKRKFNNYLLVQNAIVTVCTIPMIIVARSKPPTPPSEAATAIEKPL